MAFFRKLPRGCHHDTAKGAIQLGRFLSAHQLDGDIATRIDAYAIGRVLWWRPAQGKDRTAEGENTRLLFSGCVRPNGPRPRRTPGESLLFRSQQFSLVFGLPSPWRVPVLSGFDGQAAASQHSRRMG